MEDRLKNLNEAGQEMASVGWQLEFAILSCDKGIDVIGHKMMGVEKRQIGMDEMGEQPLLDIGDDPLARGIHHHRLAIAGQALDQEGRQDQPADLPQQASVFIRENPIQHRADEFRQGRRCGRHQRHHQPSQQEPRPIGADMLAHQTHQQRAAGGRHGSVGGHHNSLLKARQAYHSLPKAQNRQLLP